MTSIDVRDAYLHVPVRRQQRHLLAFIWDGVPWQWTCLPFGLTCAPRIFSQVMKQAVKPLRMTGMRITFYLDDLLIIGDTEESSKDAYRLAWQHLEKLGFALHTEKSVSTPVNRLKHLGFIIDSLELKVFMEPEKQVKLKKKLRKILETPTLTIKELARIIGLLVSTRDAITPYLLHTRFLEREKILFLSKNSWKGSLSLQEEAIAEADLWLQWLETWDGRYFGPELPPNYEVFFDSSDGGYGNVINGIPSSFQWTEEESRLHINQKELLTLVRCLENEPLHGVVRVYGDNIVANSYARVGGTCSLALLKLSKRIYEVCHAKNINLQVSWIQSSDNVADFASRNLIRDYEWALSAQNYQSVIEKFGTPTIDIFASRKNHVCERYCSILWDPQAFAIDGLRLSWETLGICFWNPPIPLLPKVLQK